MEPIKGDYYKVSREVLNIIKEMEVEYEHEQTRELRDRIDILKSDYFKCKL